MRSETGHDAAKSSKKEFFVDFGGSFPIVCYTERVSIADIVARNRRIYGSAQQYHYVINGVQVTTYSFGMHRAVHVVLPEDAAEETKKAYDAALSVARVLNPKGYKFLGNNCVTAVAKILHALDPNIKDNSWVPYFQFSGLSTQATTKHTPSPDDEGGSINIFMDKYTEILNEEKKRSFIPRTHYWRQDNRVFSIQEIVEHAMGLYSGTGARTKLTLIKLGWATEDPQSKLLIATLSAPDDFKQALNNYNMGPKCAVDCLRRWYKEAGGGFSASEKIFDNADSVDEVIKRLEERRQSNPNGASAETLRRREQLKEDEIKSIMKEVGSIAHSGNETLEGDPTTQKP